MGSDFSEYNLYRVPIDKYEQLVKNLLSKHFEEMTVRSNAFDSALSVRVFFCDKENTNGYPWVGMLDSYCEENIYQDSRVYGAAILFYNSDICYAATYGNAHFYMSAYADSGFGIDVAERLLDLNSIRGQQNLSHGGRASKSHTDYRRPVPVNYHSGDTPSFLQGMSVDYDTWGGKLICSGSIQVKWKENLAFLPRKLLELENALKNTKASRILPRMEKLGEEKDAELIQQLNGKLVTAIANWDSTRIDNEISIPTFYLVGTKLMQANSDSYTISCNWKSFEASGELSFEPIINFWDEHGIPYDEAIFKTNVRVESKYTVPLIELLEFVVPEQHCCLRFGKWSKYNKSYLSELYKNVDRILMQNHYEDDFKFCKNDLCCANGIFEEQALSMDRIPYETFYNNRLGEIMNWDIIHPNTEKFEDEGSVRHEVCDLLSDEALCFVKIGTSSKFAEAVDQANQTLERLARNDGKLLLSDGREIEPVKIKLILVYTDAKKKQVKRISEINSLNFLHHLDALDRDAKQQNIQIEVDFVYESSDAVLGIRAVG